MPKFLIAIMGPTAVGKTRVAIELATRYHAEIISADSRQVFRELNVGVAKPSPEELNRIAHHFVGHISIHDDYDAARFGDEALAEINRQHKARDFAVVCGGSGLYIRSLLEGFDPMPVVPDEVRRRISEAYKANGMEWLQAEVEAGDPDYFDVVDRKNPQRLMRALEIINAAGLKPSSLRSRARKDLPFHTIKIGVAMERAELYQVIDARVDTMIDKGLFSEAEGLLPFRELNSLQTVGYQEIFGYLDGQYDKAEATRLLKRNTRRYAKRQMTWFRRDQEIRWFKPDDVRGMIAHINTVAGISEQD